MIILFAVLILIKPVSFITCFSQELNDPSNGTGRTAGSGDGGYP